MKLNLFILSMVFFLISCGYSSADKAPGTDGANTKDISSYDPNRGLGKFSKIEVSPNLDDAKATAGEKVYGVKCSSCHKLTGEKLVGPGWKGVTSRHAPEWIMNFVTNTDEMINKDPKAQALLEICLVRMPNQNLSDDDARNIYEFMRKNDGVK